MQSLETYHLSGWKRVWQRIRALFQWNPPYRSQEIRWFLPVEEPGIQQWFWQLGKKINDAVPRTDTYFYLPEKNQRSIKLREGNMELKTCTYSAQEVQLSPTVQGWIEGWEKRIGKKIPNSILDDINKNKSYQRLRIQKKRIGVKVVKQQEDEYEMFDIGILTPAGCQIEYTCITANDHTWYTVGIEWYGNANPADYSDFLKIVLANSNLALTSSLSYPGFIRQVLLL